jgi:SAM-dependent methyltransferase
MRTREALLWAERWDRQQERYIADREERFTVCVDVIDAVAGGPDPLVVDLGCGPGSMLRRVAGRLSGARTVGIDNDPLLLELARHACPAATLVDADLADPALWTRWPEATVDAVVSSTALHWLPVDALRTVYTAAHRALRPGGVLVNADHLGDPRPTLAALAADLRARREARTGAVGREDWASWWRAAGSDPATADLVARRAGRGVTGGWSNRLTVAGHVDLLHDAGFHEVGPVWQYADDVVLVAVR